MSLGVQIHNGLSLGGLEALGPLAELSLEDVSITLLKQVVVSLDVLSKNVVLVNGWVELSLCLFSFFLNLLSTLVGHSLGLDHFVAGEAAFAVRNEETTIVGTLHGTENTVTSGSADETNIEVSLEWTSVGLDVAD